METTGSETTPPPPTTAITLRPITIEIVGDVCELAVAPEQSAFVAANAFSLAQAYCIPEAWPRAVYAGDTPLYPTSVPLGLVDGGTTLIVGQLAAIGVTWILAIVATFLILKVLDATMGLRDTQEDEIQGLDYSQHGEEGYIFI